MESPHEPSDHILIVDDDRDIRQLLADYLEKQGLRCTTAADGREMKAALESTAST
jgi:two-component system OmpR family response regulator